MVFIFLGLPMSQDVSSLAVEKCGERRKFAVKVLLKSLIYSFALFGLLFILLLLSVLGLLRRDGREAAVMPNQAILTIDFDADYTETRSDDLLAEVTGVQPQTFFELIRAINVASFDERVSAILGRVSISSLGLAQVQELRSAIANFRKSGKKAYIFSSGFGSFGQGTKEYYLASAFDEIIMQPNTEAGITGLAIEVPFFKKILDKIGVSAEFYSRYEYKTAMASLTDDKMSKFYKEELMRLGGGIFDRILTDIAAERNIDKAKLKELVDNAPLSAEDALKNNLIHKIMFRQDLSSTLKKEYQAELFDIYDYSDNLAIYKKGVPAIAFLVIDGVISEGNSYVNSLKSEAVTGSDTVLAQLEEISSDKDVKGMVLRINSPGGSYNAANEIWYAVQKLKEDKKIPVVVSMGNYAASGGYFAALSGDYIFAEPSTITGSIGVLGGKIVVENLWKKLDVEWNGVQFGRNAGILSPNHNFNKIEKDIFNKSLDSVYKDFTLKVSETRKLTLADVDKLARGRVWSGEAAMANGLVDGIGGIEAALGKVLGDAGIKPADRFRISYYPKEKTLQEKIQQMVGGGKGVYAREIINSLPLDIRSFEVLNRLKYDAVLLPFEINM